MLALYLSLIDDLDAKQIFENIYISHRSTMHHVADSILHDHHHSEDAVHEAFIRIIGKIEKIGNFPCHKMRSFLVIIVRNIAIDFLRSNDRYVEADLADFQEYLVDDQHDAEQTAQDNEYRQSISKVISQLPAIYLDVLTLTLICEMNAKDVAQLLSLSEEATRTRLSRGRKLLIEKLKEGHDEKQTER